MPAGNRRRAGLLGRHRPGRGHGRCWIPRLGCASIAAVRGHAYGAGLQLALACDFRIFAEGTKAGLLETRFGLLPDMGATVWLPRIVGESRARELILLGDIIDAAEALRIGLAQEEAIRCLTSEDFKEARQALAEGRNPHWRGR